MTSKRPVRAQPEVRQGKILFAWIGHADLRGVTAENPDAVGPIARTLQELPFDAAVLLNDHKGEHAIEVQKYKSWLHDRTRRPVYVLEKSLPSPTDYGAIFEAASETLREFGVTPGSAYQISPGTPAMQAVWIFLANSEFPARLLQSSPETGVSEVRLPFEIRARYVPVDVVTDAAAARAPIDSAFKSIHFRSEAMGRMLRDAQLAARADVSVLIEGPSGTGKELIARAIHSASSRRDQPFVPVNCAAFVETLLESELFGHEQGAFTGATRSRKGVFEQAHRGTLFLDEIGEMPIHTQAKLLRVLETGEVPRVGGERSIPVDVRILAATNRNLASSVSRGAFRADLYYRLLVVGLQVPALRDRREDIPLLIEKLLELTNNTFFRDARARVFTPDARRVLEAYDWPGNVRELQNTIVRCVLLSVDKEIDARAVTAAIVSVPATKGDILDQPLGNGFKIDDVLAEVEEYYIARALEAANRNKEQAARLLGLNSGTTLANRMKSLKLAPPTEKST